MATAHDVAAYILSKDSPMSTWKLQKLVYYSQAWQLVWEDQPLFPERIEAWANGPVVKDLYSKHHGDFTVEGWKWGKPSKLTQAEAETVDAVLEAYGKLTGRQLSLLTHSEGPWQEARRGLDPEDWGNVQITESSMQAFYSALDAAAESQSVSSLDWSEAS